MKLGGGGKSSRYCIWILKCIDLDRRKIIGEKSHSSLFLDEKLNNSNNLVAPTVKTTEPPRDLYLGILYSTEQHKVYGYVTNTSIKFILIVEASNTNIRDNEIRQMFRKLHNGYSNMLYNPFVS